jgi:DNA-binding NarL/FixJ family response regulator
VIRAVLADDHEVVRVGLRSLLELAGDIELVAEASSGQEAVERVVATRPDVLLLDVRMPRGDGFFVLEELARLGAPTATLVLTTFDDGDLALQAIGRGARGYLLKDVKLTQLVSAVRTLAAGGTLLSPGVSEQARLRLAEATPRAESALEATPETMTPREREILRLLAGGYSNREIAQALHVAEGTVKNHVSNILAKMGVRDRTRAVLRAAERGFLE